MNTSIKETETISLNVLENVVGKLKERGMSDRAIYYWFEYAVPETLEVYKYELISYLKI